MFLKAYSGQILAFDEVHRLDDPALLLKIAADHFPETRIVATGSSTLGASSKFRDTLAGRKAELYLTPLCEADSNFPHYGDRTRRLLHGGLPAFFLSDIAMKRITPSGLRLSGRETFLSFFAWSGGHPSLNSLKCSLHRAEEGSMLQSLLRPAE